jgi:hypothetical protein
MKQFKENSLPFRPNAETEIKTTNLLAAPLKKHLKINKLHGLSPRANYIDTASADCR